MGEYMFVRDRLGLQTPNGRPARKPRRLAAYYQHDHSSSNYNYVLNRPRTAHTIGLYRCMSLRPPLQMECLTTPSPCTYNLPCSSLEARGTTRFGACPKHPRGILPYPSTGVWTTNVSAQDNQRPSPCSYRIATMGSKHPNKHNAPSYSMGGRTTYPLLIKRGKREQLEAILIALRLIGTEKEPAPNTYNIENVQLSTMNNSPAYSIALPAKTGQKGSSTPGPNHYHPVDTLCYHSSPAYSFRYKHKLNGI